MAQAIQDSEERFVIRSGFHPQDVHGNLVIAHFLDHDAHQLQPCPRRIIQASMGTVIKTSITIFCRTASLSATAAKLEDAGIWFASK